MTALQPSDKSLFKDASEAEQALREGWERCLTQGLIHPAVLAMDEVPHDKAPARMHEPRGQVVRPPLSSLNDTSEVTEIDDKMAVSIKVPSKAVVVAAAPDRVRDDDPTQLMIRDESKPKPDPTSKGVGTTSKPPPSEKDHKTAKVKREELAPSDVHDTKADTAARPTHQGGNKLAVIAIALAVLLVAAAAGLYIGGVIP